MKNLIFFTILILLALTSCKDEHEQITYTLLVYKTEGGEVDPYEGKYYHGDTVTITAIAYENFVFRLWSGFINSTDNPLTLVMDGNKVITANFVADTDGDGVPDNIDQCPNSQLGVDIDSNGCEIIYDADGDGVPDDIDQCPDTQIGVLVDSKGCDLIYLDENGVTIKAGFEANVGDTSTINGKLYTVIDETMLRNAIENGDIITNMVTTFIVKMDSLFFDKREFNQDICSWDVSNVTDMTYMFGMANNFNQDISNWDVGSLTVARYMFYRSDNFNQDISSWDVSSVTDMQYMFDQAISFNQDISSWNVSNVIKCNFFTTSNSWTEPKPNFTNCSY